MTAKLLRGIVEDLVWGEGGCRRSESSIASSEGRSLLVEDGGEGGGVRI